MKSRYAKDPEYPDPGDDLTETKFMENWVVKLKKENNGKIEIENDTESCTVYKWEPPKGRQSKEEDDDLEPDEAHICDTGGHSEYTLMNSVSLTDKALIYLMFNSSKYFGHTESYQQMVGSYVDLIMSSTKD